MKKLTKVILINVALLAFPTLATAEVSSFNKSFIDGINANAKEMQYNSCANTKNESDLERRVREQRGR